MKNNNVFRAYLFGEINATSAEKVVREIDEASSKEVKKIILTLSSGGGSFLFSLSIYTHIKGCPIPVEIITEGQCGSGAVFILQAGHKRISRPNTFFTLHPPSHSFNEPKSVDEVMSIAGLLKRYDELYVGLIAKRIGMTPKTLKRQYDPVKYIRAQEALIFGKHGLIDSISP